MTHDHYRGPATLFQEARNARNDEVDRILSAGGHEVTWSSESEIHGFVQARGFDAFDPAKLRAATDVAADIVRARAFTASDEECLMSSVTYQPGHPRGQRWTWQQGTTGGNCPTLDDALRGVEAEARLCGINPRDAAPHVQARKMDGRWEDLRVLSDSFAREGGAEHAPMTGEQLACARRTLSAQWGISLSAADFGRLLGFVGRDPGLTVLDYEKGKRPVSGPVTLAVQLMLDGARPSDLEDRLRR